MAAYDKMTDRERRELLEDLGNLTGLQSWPAGSLPDGTHYEYDSDLKTTVEVSPSGDRRPVTLVEGVLKRVDKNVPVEKDGG
jgi:hypothetical protein